MDFNKIFNVHSTLTEKYTATGARERYCASNLFQYLTLKSDRYTYSFSSTNESDIIGYDGTLVIRNKWNLDIVGYFLIEVKVRDKHYDELVLEQRKYKGLMSHKNKFDKYLKNQYSNHTVGVLYVNFTPKGSYVYDLCHLTESKQLPKLQNLTSDKYTVDPSQGQSTKKTYYLENKLGVRYNWLYDESTYYKSMKKDANRDIEVVQQAEKRIGIIF